MPQPLENIKVVDLTRTLAGPFCTQNLADMGADVIKIEEPNTGDETRHWPPIWNEESTQFLSFNRNKRSLSVNLKSEEGLSIVKQLATEADVMIESFRAGALARMGLGYEDIKALNPDIVYCTISGYGRTGPMANKPGYDLVIQAYSGLMHLTGEPDGPPQRVGFSLVDLFTGMMAYGSIVTALYHRDKTGDGQLIVRTAPLARRSPTTAIRPAPTASGSSTATRTASRRSTTTSSTSCSCRAAQARYWWGARCSTARGAAARASPAVRAIRWPPATCCTSPRGRRTATSCPTGDTSPTCSCASRRLPRS